MNKEPLLRTPFEVHPDKSCRINIIPGPGSTVQKIKKRKKEKLIREFYALHFYQAVLKTLQLPISTPNPIAIFPEHSILEMSIVPGVDIENYRGMRFTPKQRANDFESIIRLLGSTSRIKDQLGLVHGDYQARHVFYTPSPETCSPLSLETQKIFDSVQFRVHMAMRNLSVIDVENSYTGDFCKASEENEKIMKQLNPWLQNIRSLRDSVKDHYEDGYYSPQANLPFTLADYIDSAVHSSGITEVDFSFNPKRTLSQQ